ncbi:MAG: hypothetical protein K9L68_12975 [Spirochaetales bacterium]|nr:hypothetical protein [Spirochaetales bacterium]
MQEDKTEKQQQETLPYALRLRNLKCSKQSFARLLRAYSRGEISQEFYKDLIYGLSQYAHYLKMHSEQEILERLEKLEEKQQNEK